MKTTGDAKGGQANSLPEAPATATARTGHVLRGTGRDNTYSQGSRRLSGSCRALAGFLLLVLTAGYSDRQQPAWTPTKFPPQTKQTIVKAGAGVTEFAALPEKTALTNRIDPEWLKPPTEPFTLGPGDRLEIGLIDTAEGGISDAESRAIVPVGPDGKIYFSILPGIDVWGLTLSQAKERIEQEFGRYMRERPQVGITLRGIESKRVWLLGRFQAPGVYAISAPTTLLEAIAAAGGGLSTTATGNAQEITFAANSQELADLRRAFLIRNGQMVPIDFERLLKQGDLSQNIYLQPDDFVYLPAGRAQEIYVMGAVNSPRAVAFQEGMTLVGAIASGGGTFKDSYVHHVAIVRGSLAQPQMAVVDYKEIIRGHRPDVLLEPHDIVYVPLKPYRHIIRYLNLIANTFVTTVAINEGANSVNQNIPPTGIVIPLGSTITINRPTTIQAR